MKKYKKPHVKEVVGIAPSNFQSMKIKRRRRVVVKNDGRHGSMPFLLHPSLRKEYDVPSQK